MSEQNNYWIMGVGGFGCQAVDFLNKKFPHILMYAMDTDTQELSPLSILNKFLIGEELISALGSAGDASIAKKLFNVSAAQLEKTIKSNKNKRLFIIAGLGRGTGSGITPEIVKIANKYHIKTHLLAISLMPWTSKKDYKKNIANDIELIKNLNCGITYFDDDFLRRETGSLLINLAFKKTCMLLKEQLDEIEKIYTEQITKEKKAKKITSKFFNFPLKK